MLSFFPSSAPCARSGRQAVTSQQLPPPPPPLQEPTATNFLRREQLHNNATKKHSNLILSTVHSRYSALQTAPTSKQNQGSLSCIMAETTHTHDDNPTSNRRDLLVLHARLQLKHARLHKKKLQKEIKVCSVFRPPLPPPLSLPTSARKKKKTESSASPRTAWRDTISQAPHRFFVRRHPFNPLTPLKKTPE